MGWWEPLSLRHLPRIIWSDAWWCVLFFVCDWALRWAGVSTDIVAAFAESLTLMIVSYKSATVAASNSRSTTFFLKMYGTVFIMHCFSMIDLYISTAILTDSESLVIVFLWHNFSIWVVFAVALLNNFGVHKSIVLGNKVWACKTYIDLTRTVTKRCPCRKRVHSFTSLGRLPSFFF